MAIEFNCPYCTAAIRVPDEFSGKRGSCPKCATKLIVPDVAPTRTAESSPISTESPAKVPDIPQPADAVPQTPDIVAPVAATSVSRKLKRKARRRKSQGLYGTIVPVICFLLFFGMVAGVMYFRVPELKGQLTGSVAGEMELPKAIVSLHNLQLPDAKIAEAAESFEGATETFTSPQMSCSIAVDGDNLQISLRTGEGYVWYAVNPSANVPLSDWLRSSQTAINTHRLQSMAATGTELCEDKILKQSGTPVVFDALKYRDYFGLSAQVDAFGYVVEAVVGNKLTPCAHEDSNGTLYFSLPVGTKSFQLRGRDFKGGKLFPGEYTVKVAGLAAPLPEPASEHEASPPTDEPDPEVQDWDPSSPTPEMKNSPPADEMEPAVL